MKVTLEEGQFYKEETKVVKEPIPDEFVLEQYNAGKQKYDENEVIISEKLAEIRPIQEEQETISPTLENLESLLKEKGLLEEPTTETIEEEDL